jgi:hypothetical protein
VTTVRQLIPAFFVLFVVLGMLMSFFHIYLAAAYLLIFTLYWVMAFREAFSATRELSIVFNIVYSFLILHWSYGTGYLKGIFDFFILNRKTISEENMKLSR